MKKEITLKLPKSTSPEVVEYINDALKKKYSMIDVIYKFKEGITRPVASRLSAESDFGSIDGDCEAPAVALMSGLQKAATRAYREAISK